MIKNSDMDPSSWVSPLQLSKSQMPVVTFKFLPGSNKDLFVCSFVWFLNILVHNLAISRTGPKTDVWQFYVLPHMRQSWETMTSVSTGHIILTPTQPVGRGQPQPNRTQDLLSRSRALATELPRPLDSRNVYGMCKECVKCAVADIPAMTIILCKECVKCAVADIPAMTIILCKECIKCV